MRDEGRGESNAFEVGSRSAIETPIPIRRGVSARQVAPRMANAQDKPQAHRRAGRRAARPLHPLRAAHLLADAGDDGALEDHFHHHPCIIGHVARPVHAAAADQAALHPRRHHAGAAPRRRVPGRGAEAFRHAADPRRRRRGRASKDRGGSPRLHGRRAGAARRAHGGDDGRRAGRAARGRRASASSWSARQSGRPILPVAIATSRYVALNTWSRMTINLPYSGLGFAVGAVVHGAARGDRPRSWSATGRRSRTRSTWRPSRPTRAPAPIRRAPRPARRLRAAHEPGLRLKSLPHADQPGAAGGAACCCGLRERRGKEEPARRSERLGPAERRAAGRAGSPGSTPPASARPTPSCR